MITKAKGTVGYLIYDHALGRFVFRVYSENKDSFTDYDIKVDDLEIRILDNFCDIVNIPDGDSYIAYHKK